MVYGSNRQKTTGGSRFAFKFTVSAFIAASAVLLKLMFPVQTADAAEELEECLMRNWNAGAAFESIKGEITSVEDLKYLASGLYAAVFGKQNETPDAQITESEKTSQLPASILSVRSYAVSEYLDGAGLGGEIVTIPVSDEFVAPANGSVSSLFGWREHPVTGKMSFHTGVDLAVNEGCDVCAVYDGTVSEVGEDSVYGNYVLLSHPDGTDSFYAHLFEALVQPGDAVRAGQNIGLSGCTGLVTGPHLHFELRENGNSVDPLMYIDSQL